jgi:AcrR family transcriptional regulator
VPRITEAHREARRAQIVAAACRCFSRDGFHQTAMPSIAAEAGVSVGAPYRYFASKEEIILEIAGAAFQLIFDPVERLSGQAGHQTVSDLVAAAVEPVAADHPAWLPGLAVEVDDLLRCGVQAWGELLRNDGLRQRAVEGFDRVRHRIAESLRRGQRAGTVPGGIDPERGARVVMALLHGFVLQRVAFGLDDTAGFVHDVQVLFREAGLLAPPGPAAGEGHAAL